VCLHGGRKIEFQMPLRSSTAACLVLLTTIRLCAQACGLCVLWTLAVCRCHARWSLDAHWCLWQHMQPWWHCVAGAELILGRCASTFTATALAAARTLCTAVLLLLLHVPICRVPWQV
jgi:hypothetical protein